MRHFNLLVVVCAFLPVHATAQAFAPFEPGSRKLFGPLQGPFKPYEIAFDSTTVAGGTTTYHNYKALQDSVVRSNCGLWGECQRQDRPTWIGDRIDKDDQGLHRFFTVSNDTLTLHFSTVPSSRTLVYQDRSQRFLLGYGGESTIEVLGMTENVRRWTVIHEDLDGGPINSTLSNASVEVGESIGLVRFFRVDSFPVVLEPVGLIGQAEPQLGLHRITPAMLHDFQPGDVVQKHIHGHDYSGPIPQNFNSFNRVRILSREDTPMTVNYVVETSSFNMGSGSETVQTGTVSYSKTDVIAALPFSRSYGTQPILRMEDYCGLPMWTYRISDAGSLTYCPEEDCWWRGGFGGPWPEHSLTYVAGIGVFDKHDYLSGSDGYSIFSSIVYFTKNGIPCGTEAIVGIEDHTAATPSLLLAPNPAQDRVRILGLGDALRVELFSASGRLVLDHALSNNGWLDVGELHSGLYLMRVITSSGAVRAGRLMIER